MQSHRLAQFANYDASGRLWDSPLFLRATRRHSLRSVICASWSVKIYSRQRIHAE